MIDVRIDLELIIQEETLYVNLHLEITKEGKMMTEITKNLIDSIQDKATLGVLTNRREIQIGKEIKRTIEEMMIETPALVTIDKRKILGIKIQNTKTLKRINMMSVEILNRITKNQLVK